jgi:hypothetical protein
MSASEQQQAKNTITRKRKFLKVLKTKAQSVILYPYKMRPAIVPML